ncbi:MAG: glycoside hydrolase family 25 [Clostridia bacterium]|nr:glycoside hydrolase family 25 [Clostridia bacterium]
MKKLWKALLIVVIILLAAFLTVFALAKAKIILLNRWFVDEKRSTIGVDLSAYQADVDMGALKAQGVAFAYIKATEGSSHQDKRFPENWKNAAEAGLLSGAYHFFSYDSPGATQAENYIGAVGEDLTGKLLPAVVVDYYGDKEKNPPLKEDVVRELSVFIDALETQYGVKPMIYTRSDIYEKYLEGTFDSHPYWISSLYTPLKWNYHGDWYLWHYLNRGILEGYEGGEKYIDLDVLNEEKTLDELIVK